MTQFLIELIVIVLTVAFVNGLQFYSALRYRRFDINSISILQSRSHLLSTSGQILSMINNIDIIDFADEEEPSGPPEQKDNKTHGYEGDFKVGDRVRVIKNITIFSVKKYSQSGFNIHGYTGKVAALLLYGKKYGTLCSAITPIKVQFQPGEEGVSSEMFQKPFFAHFCAEELEHVTD